MQPNQEQALVCFPAQGGHAVCWHTMRMVLWGEAGVAIFLIVFCGWWWAGSLRLGCNHCDGCFRVAPVALFSDQSHLNTGRVDLLLLPQLFLSSVGNRVLRDSLPASPSRGEWFWVETGGICSRCPNHEREDCGCSLALGTHNDPNRKSWTPPAHFTLFPMDYSKWGMGHFRGTGAGGSQKTSVTQEVSDLEIFPTGKSSINLLFSFEFIVIFST